jgi:hypothetical protein
MTNVAKLFGSDQQQVFLFLLFFEFFEKSFLFEISCPLLRQISDHMKCTCIQITRTRGDEDNGIGLIKLMEEGVGLMRRRGACAASPHHRQATGSMDFHLHWPVATAKL